MNKKLIWGIVIIVLIVLSQWLSVRMVYSQKITGAPAKFFAKVYNLKAGTIVKDDVSLNIYLSDYFANKDFVKKFIDRQLSNQDTLMTDEQLPKDEEIDELVWDKLLKEAWLKDIAKKNQIVVDQEEIDQHLAILGDPEEIRKAIPDEYGVPFEVYQDMVVIPFILESKVHEQLLNDFSDIEGTEKAQEAYTLLEGGESFEDVALQYSDDMTYVDSSLFIPEGDLVDFYEPIKELESGDFSKIVTVPLGYIIWQLDSVSEDEEPIYEVRGIFIAAKTLSSFLEDFLYRADIKEMY